MTACRQSSHPLPSLTPSPPNFGGGKLPQVLSHEKGARSAAAGYAPFSLGCLVRETTALLRGVETRPVPHWP